MENGNKTFLTTTMHFVILVTENIDWSLVQLSSSTVPVKLSNPCQHEKRTLNDDNDLHIVDMIVLAGGNGLQNPWTFKL